MEHDHLDAEALEQLLALDRTEVQNRNLLHQIAVCPKCRDVGGWLLELHRSGAIRLRFGVIDVELARSRAEAPNLWRRLAGHAQEKRLGLIHATRSFASWGLAEHLAQESERIAAEDAAQAVELAELAVAVAEAVEDNQPAEARWTYQLRALAWSYLGNARRAAGNLAGAEQGFHMADSWWDAGADSIGDVLGYEPAILDLKASRSMEVASTECASAGWSHELRSVLGSISGDGERSWRCGRNFFGWRSSSMPRWQLWSFQPYSWRTGTWLR